MRNSGVEFSGSRTTASRSVRVSRRAATERRGEAAAHRGVGIAVANGTGDEYAKAGYTGRLRELHAAPMGSAAQSVRAAQHDDSQGVLLGSVTGQRSLAMSRRVPRTIRSSRMPVITLRYTRMDFTEVAYEYTTP